MLFSQYSIYVGVSNALDASTHHVNELLLTIGYG